MNPSRVLEVIFSFGDTRFAFRDLTGWHASV
jgi:hypothetical protein